MPDKNKTDEVQTCSKDNTSRYLGSILKRVRRRKCLSQNALSEAANINNSYYCSIERGTVNLTIRKFISICDSLHVKPEVIMRTLQCFRESKEEYIEADYKEMDEDK